MGTSLAFCSACCSPSPLGLELLKLSLFSSFENFFLSEIKPSTDDDRHDNASERKEDQGKVVSLQENARSGKRARIIYQKEKSPLKDIY